jgi:hypothetical protein
MTELHESLTVHIAFDQTPQAAEAYLASLPLVDGKRVVPIRIEIGDLVIERRVDLVLKSPRTYPGNVIMDIQWGPHDGGPYPIFNGMLSVEETGTNICRIDLDGHYQPPLGLAGAVFDAAIGHRIALGASRQLLDEIKTGFEMATKSPVR